MYSPGFSGECLYVPQALLCFNGERKWENMSPLRCVSFNSLEEMFGYCVFLNSFFGCLVKKRGNEGEREKRQRVKEGGRGIERKRERDR